MEELSEEREEQSELKLELESGGIAPEDQKEKEDEDEVFVELNPPLEELRGIAKEQKDREAVLNLMLEKSKEYRQLQKDRLEHAILAEENAKRAKENELKEEETFNDSGNEFYDMLCKTYYIRRNPEESSCHQNFIVSSQPSHKKGEIMVYTSGGRMIIRPAIHNNYSLSMPIFGGTGNSQTATMKISRKGGPLKHSSRLKTGRNTQEFQLGKTRMRNVRGRQVKTPFTAPPKKPKVKKVKEPFIPHQDTNNDCDGSDDDDIILYTPKKKKIPTATPKLKKAGRCPIARIHPKKR